MSELNLDYYQEQLHNKFVELLPQLEQCVAYGEATKIIQKELDSNFGKPPEVDEYGDELKEYRVRVSVSGSRTYTIKAATEKEAKELAEDEAGDDFCDCDDIEITDCEEVMP